MSPAPDRQHMVKPITGRPVEIRIVSSQTAQDADEPIEQVVSGRRYKKDGRVILAYREAEASGLGRTLTTMTIGPVDIGITRRGEQHARMLFSPGTWSTVRIRTPFGSAELACLTHAATHTADETGGLVRLSYVLGREDTAPHIELNLRYRYT